MSALTDVFTDIANSIRSKLGTADTFKPTQMANAINNISGGGGGASITRYRYHILTKSTGQSDAAITVSKYKDEVLVSSTDYLYTDLTDVVNFDNYFTIQWTGGYTMTFLKASTDMSAGGKIEWTRTVEKDFSETFIESSGMVVLTNVSRTLLNAFNLPVEITNDVTSITYAFNGFNAFNQPINFPQGLLYMNSAFAGCNNFNQPINIPSTVNYMTGAFASCAMFNQPINVDNPNDYVRMGYCFSPCNNLNQPVNINYASMPNCFANCINFNQPVKINRIGNGYYTFRGCSNLNSPVTINFIDDGADLRGFFWNCYNFNQPMNIPGNGNLYGFFNNCANFNQPVYFGASQRYVDFGGIFFNCQNFNQPLELPASVKTIQSCFFNCINLNQPIGFSNNNVDSVNLTDMHEMFCNCYNFNQPVPWFTNAVNLTNAQNAFHNCFNFNQPVNIPETRAKLNAIQMFWNCNSLNQPIYVSSNVNTVCELLLNCVNYGSVITFANAQNVVNCLGMLRGTDNGRRKEIHVGVGGNMTNLVKTGGAASLVGAVITYQTNDVCAWNEAYNIYIYNDR